MITQRVTTALNAFLMATIIVSGAALTPTAPQAAGTSNVASLALKKTTAACKAGAKEKKIRWPASRKYVNDCIAKTVKLTPVELQKVVVKQATVACKAEAKGKKVRWRARQKYVKNCIAAALKEHPTIDITELSRGVNVKTLPEHQWGCDEKGC